MLRVTTEITGYAGAPYYSTMHFGGETQPEADAAVGGVFQFWEDWAAVMASGGQVNVNNDVDVVDPATGQVTAQLQVPTLAITPSGPAEILPPTCQALVRWSTGTWIAGRQLRGRTFIPAMMETNSVAGRPNGASIPLWQAYAETLLSTTDFGIYSPTHRVFHLGATATVWQEWASLRSRRD